MEKREPALAKALGSLQSAFESIVPPVHPAANVLEDAFDALSIPHIPSEATVPRVQAATRLFVPAVEDALDGPAHSAGFAKNLMGLAPKLHWIKAENMAPGNEMPDDYAECYLVGPNGIEVREDVQVGISILNRDIVYPGHRHPPEEIYLALTGGYWRQNGDDWSDHAAGSFVHNASQTLHSMAAKPYSQLSVWVLLNK